MASKLGLGFIWLVGMRDAILTKTLMDRAGLDAELNLLGRWMMGSFGTVSIFWFKAASLLVFTGIILFVEGRCKRRAGIGVAIGAAASALLAIWWDIVLTTNAGWHG